MAHPCLILLYSQQHDVCYERKEGKDGRGGGRGEVKEKGGKGDVWKGGRKEKREGKKETRCGDPNT